MAYNIATTAHLVVKHLAILPQTYTFTDDKKFNITLSSACSGSFWVIHYSDILEKAEKS